MNGLEHLRSSPALQLLKQLDAPLAIASKAVAQCGFILNSEPLLTAMRVIQQGQSLQNELAVIAGMTIQPQRLSEVASLAGAWGTTQKIFASEAAPLAKAIGIWAQDLASGTASMTTA